jgi:hypothetical protein
VLDTVHARPGTPHIFWLADLTSRPVLFSDHRHLNLVLYPGNAVTWTVALPPTAKQADVHSAVATSASAPDRPTANDVTFEIYPERSSEAEWLLFSRNLGPGPDSGGGSP